MRADGGAGRAASRRGRRTGALLSGMAVAGAVGLGAGVAVHFARRVLTPAPKPDDRLELLRFDEPVPAGESPVGARAWLRGPECELEGSYSFIFDAGSRLTQESAGHARLGPVLQRSRRSGRLEVLREVLSVERGRLRPGARGRLTGWWFTDPEQLGYESSLVALPVPHGVSWAWAILAPDAHRRAPAEAERWAVHVHGRGALPQETLRGVRPCIEAGINCLVIAYRNDPGAPAGIGGRYALGLAEREDVEAAIAWVRARGATRVVLVGWSMGATACLLAAVGRHRRVVEGLVLDSPALDWCEILRAQSGLARLPEILGRAGMLLLRAGAVRGAVAGERRTDLRSISGDRLISLIEKPTLIHASPGDTFVPWGGALRAAALKPGLVRLWEGRGEHVKLWNVDPEGWETSTARFLREL